MFSNVTLILGEKLREFENGLGDYRTDDFVITHRSADIY